jgi:hypothetical protein
MWGEVEIIMPGWLLMLLVLSWFAMSSALVVLCSAAAMVWRRAQAQRRNTGSYHPVGGWF